MSVFHIIIRVKLSIIRCDIKLFFYRIGEYVQKAGGLPLIDELLQGDLAKSKIAKQGLEDMKLLLK